VVIKEYVDVAGAFFGPDESGMINAVLDGLARQMRADEFVVQA
jgi:N utilization substance protein B